MDKKLEYEARTELRYMLAEMHRERGQEADKLADQATVREHKVALRDLAADHYDRALKCENHALAPWR